MHQISYNSTNLVNYSDKVEINLTIPRPSGTDLKGNNKVAALEPGQPLASLSIEIFHLIISVSCLHINIFLVPC